ncbi:MAG TPA: hypothetical protein VNT54_06520 [Solirubrobacteraceae bacterium]|nr:hypothetical protein [Solirubrobacteraceae bacterium]
MTADPTVTDLDRYRTPGRAGRLAAQDHHNENNGDSEMHVLFVELEEPAPGGRSEGGPQLGPAGG